MSRQQFRGVVYSTGTGRNCPDCGQPKALCSCSRRGIAPAPRDGIVRVSRQTQGRGGKGVTLITGAPVSAEGLALLCTELKKRCGSGGTVKGAQIEIQGDHRDTIVALLGGKGWQVRRAGG